MQILLGMLSLVLVAKIKGIKNMIKNYDYTIIQTNTLIRNILVDSQLPITIQYFLLQDILKDVSQLYNQTVNKVVQQMQEQTPASVEKNEQEKIQDQVS